MEMSGPLPLCNQSEGKAGLSQSIRILAEGQRKRKGSFVQWCDGSVTVSFSKPAFPFFPCALRSLYTFLPYAPLPELEEFRWSGCQGSLSAINDKEQFSVLSV